MTEKTEFRQKMIQYNRIKKRISVILKLESKIFLHFLFLHHIPSSTSVRNGQKYEQKNEMQHWGGDNNENRTEISSWFI